MAYSMTALDRRQDSVYHLQRQRLGFHHGVESVYRRIHEKRERRADQGLSLSAARHGRPPVDQCLGYGGPVQPHRKGCDPVSALLGKERSAEPDLRQRGGPRLHLSVPSGIRRSFPHVRRTARPGLPSFGRTASGRGRAAVPSHSSPAGSR